MTFEPLPVIEFELADGISDEEAARLLAADPHHSVAKYARPMPCYPAYALLPIPSTLSCHDIGPQCTIGPR